MGSDEHNHTDKAGELHAEIVRLKARELRADQRRMALIYESRGWEASRICEALDLDFATLAQFLAFDGHLVCTECAFSRHPFCDRFYTDATRTAPCECHCRSVAP